MFNVLIVASVCAFLIIFNVSAGPTHISVEKTFHDNTNYQNLHITLQSIEGRLRNLENSLSTQCEIAINGKIEYYGQKIDNIEKDLSRFQVYMRIELDKISENISSKNFKDDITKDRTVRKIDMIYERISHKLGNIEEQIDIANIKSQNAREMMMTKLEKMEENLTIRDADMEAELADAVAAIDDLKTTCTNMEENILNATRDTTKGLCKGNEKLSRKQHTQTINFLENANKSSSAILTNIKGNMDFLLHQINNTAKLVKGTKENLDDNLNEYENKVTDMYTDLWKKTDLIANNIQNLAKVTNLTRSEQQNGLRALMVQVGRKSGKQGIQSDSALDNQKLVELNQKIDTNFENIMLAQNLFLESCHRVQMDESQLESQISILLDKLIDIFENKTSVSPQDIKQLEQLIRTHDSNIRRSLYHIMNNLLALMKKTTDGNDEVIDYANNQKLQLAELYTLLQDILQSGNDVEKTHSIVDTIQDFERQLNQTTQETHATLSQINSTNNLIVNILNASHSGNTSTTNAKLQESLQFIKSIYHILSSLEIKINKSYLEFLFNKLETHRFDRNLNNHTSHIDGSTIFKKGTVADKKQEIPKLILEIFGEHQNTEKSIDPYDDFPYTIKSNSSASSNESAVEIDDIVLLCNNEAGSSNCDTINNTKYTVEKQNDGNNISTPNCLPNYIDLIDVRSNSDTNSSLNYTFPGNSTNTERLENLTNSSTKNCLPNYVDTTDVRGTYGTNSSWDRTLINTTVDGIPGTSTNKSENTSINKCLPNYVDMIDVRSNAGTDCANTTVNSSGDNSTSFTNMESYDTDMRNESTNTFLMRNTSEDTVQASDSSIKIKGTTENWVSTTTEEFDKTENILVAESWTEMDENEETMGNVEIGGQTTLDEEGDLIEENYLTSSLEDDTIDSNREFEYTNHEYH